MSENWEDLQHRIVGCERCPRLREHCLKIAREKRASFRDWDYWGLPVPNFGDPAGRLLLVGLAPAAHGANRTGRMFTGDRSGDFLYEAMCRTGFANQPEAEHVDDGLQLRDAVITAAAHCAPPANKPTAGELNNCRVHLLDTFKAMPNLRGILCLGGIALTETLKFLPDMGYSIPSPKPKFAHGKVFEVPHAHKPLFIASTYHPSQQNTFTGRLTMDMLCAVFQDVRERLDSRQEREALS